VEIISPVFGEGIWKPLAELNDYPIGSMRLKEDLKLTGS